MGNITLLDIKDFVISLAAFLAAGAAIGTMALKFGKSILTNELKPFKEEIKKTNEARLKQHEETKREIATLKEELNRNSLNTMKNTICNNNIPITERLMVGKEYIEKGGNGAVKIYLHKLEEDFERDLHSRSFDK